MNDDISMVMENEVKLIIDNGNANAITVIGAGGHILLASENDGLQWKIGDHTGTYSLPLSTHSMQKIPLGVTITEAGSADGTLFISSYETSDDQNTPLPASVTSMNSSIAGGEDGGLYAIDRFWVINADSYTFKPNMTLSFGYDDNDNEMGIENTIDEPSLVAQYFNTMTDQWEGNEGIVDFTENSVSNVDVLGSAFHGIWALVGYSNPLPIELLSFTGRYVNHSVELKWSTASEVDNDYFTIERATAEFSWKEIKKIDGAGQSTTILNYQEVDYHVPNEQLYYRLKQTDYDGSFEYSEMITINQGLSDQILAIYPNPVGGMLSIEMSNLEHAELKLFNNYGQQVAATYSVNSMTGRIDVSQLPNGLYFLECTTSSQKSIKKILVKHQ
ncbi:hypothetical protein BFP72_07425 [Reichenbachiella sp. 5M10]|nr:hypothetical protein BFP72_07425 [Reichenbachiella sp. 5M10]